VNEFQQTIAQTSNRELKMPGPHTSYLTRAVLAARVVLPMGSRSVSMIASGRQFVLDKIGGTCTDAGAGMCFLGTSSVHTT
jgi:hypothetical protein